jgi:hypothetical protein
LQRSSSRPLLGLRVVLAGGYCGWWVGWSIEANIPGL